MRIRSEFGLQALDAARQNDEASLMVLYGTTEVHVRETGLEIAHAGTLPVENKARGSPFSELPCVPALPCMFGTVIAVTDGASSHAVDEALFVVDVAVVEAACEGHAAKAQHPVYVVLAWWATPMACAAQDFAVGMIVGKLTQLVFERCRTTPADSPVATLAYR